MSTPRPTPVLEVSRRAPRSAGIVLAVSMTVGLLVGAEAAEGADADRRPAPLPPHPAAVVEIPVVVCAVGLAAAPGVDKGGASVLEISWDAPEGYMAQVGYSTSPSHLEWIEFTRDVSAHGKQAVSWKPTEFQLRALAGKPFEVVVYSFYKDPDTGRPVRVENRIPVSLPGAAAPSATAPSAK